MDITSVLGLGSNQQNVQRANSGKLQAVIDTIVNNQRASQATDDVAAISTAAQLQASEAGLKQVSVSLVETDSEVQIIEEGIDQIESALQALQTLATQATDPSLTDDKRAELDAQFQEVVQTIDATVEGTTFEGKPLLDGSLTGEQSLSLEETLTGSRGDENDITLSIEDLSSNVLLGEEPLDLTTVENAQEVLTIVNSALQRVVGTSEAVDTFQEAVSAVEAYVDSVSANLQAAQSTLQESDFGDGTTATQNIQGNAKEAIAAQGNRLNPALLNLVG